MKASYSGIANNSSTNQFVKNLYANDEKYKPLNKDEERELIEKYRDDREKLNQELINHNILLVFSTCRKYSQTAEDFDDLLMNGMYGLALAAQKFDIDAGTKFCTYASWWIRKYILAPYYDKYTTKIKNFSVELDSPIVSQADKKSGSSSKTSFANLVDSQICPTYVKPVQSIETDIRQMDYKTIVDSLTAEIMISTELSALDKQVYSLCFLENQSINVASQACGVENTSVYKSRKKVNRFVKDVLKTKFNITKFSDI